MPVQAVRDLRVDGRAELHKAAERRLHMTARTAEAVVEVEVAEGGVEIVAPHQHDDAAAEPYAFRIAGGAIDDLGRFDEFVGALLTFTDNFSRGRAAGRGLLLLAERSADGCDNSTYAKQNSNRWRDQTTQHQRLKPEYASTHKVPDKLAVSHLTFAR